MDMAKRFTLPEAQSLIPRVERLLQDAIQLKPDFDRAGAQLTRMKERIHMNGGTVVDRPPFVEVKERRDRASQGLRKSIQELLDLGVQIKDLDTGLVDFPTMFRGKEVYLCWKLGETAIEFWHGEEGFRGRKPIDQDFLDHHEGDRTQ
jgi:hypothetical protein